MEFLRHHFDKPKYIPAQAIDKGLNFEAPLKVLTRLTNKRTGEKVEQEVFLGDIPQMTSVGTFIINGIERAVVTQLVRSPGVFFSGETDPLTGRVLYKAELRPLRGSWLEFIVSRNDVVSVRIDRHRKFPATVFLRAIGVSEDKDLEHIFAQADKDNKNNYFHATLGKDSTKNTQEALI